MPIAVDPKLAEIRRTNLRRLVLDRFEGNRTAFAKVVIINPNQVNLMLSDNESIRRPMTDLYAERIEGALGLDEGFMSRPSGAPPVGTHYIACVSVNPSEHFEPNEALADSSQVRTIGLSDEWVRSRAGKISCVENLRLAQVVTDEMMPKLTPGEVVIFEPFAGKGKIAGPGCYLLAGKAGYFLRQVKPLLPKGFQVSVGNGASEEMTDAQMGSIRIAGRIVTAVKFS